MNDYNCQLYHQQFSELQWKLNELESSLGWANQSIEEANTAIGWKKQELEELLRAREERIYKRESIAQGINAIKQSMQQIRDAMWHAGCSGY